MFTDQLITLKVFELEPRLKHPTVFECFDKLSPGASFIIENDHDPLPLYYELKAERNGQLISFDYLQNGPEVWKVKISKAGNAGEEPATCPVCDTQHSAPASPIKEAADLKGDTCSIGAAPKTSHRPVLDVTQLPPQLKHPTIFKWFNELKAGESFLLKNDHDPKPLYYQMYGMLGSVFNWEYVQQGPVWWEVIIQKKSAGEETVGELAARDSRKAQAMAKLGIDFCCGGNKTISQAAREAGLTPAQFEQALNEAKEAPSGFTHSFDKWDADFLADYIYNQHHKYFYENRYLILQLAGKVQQVHGEAHPELEGIHNLVRKLFEELTDHFEKEEEILFPYIKELAVYKRNGDHPLIQSSLSDGPLAAMYHEHETAGDLLKTLRHLSGNYQPPVDACGSYRRLYSGLEELEKDLHQHIHLENNILFVKAVEIEKEFSR